MPKYGILQFFLYSYIFLLLKNNEWIPEVIQFFMAIAVIWIVVDRLLRFQRWDDEIPNFFPFTVAFLIMIIELMFENMMVWTVSATDQRKYDDVPALQDNIALICGTFMNKSSVARTMLEFQPANTFGFLIWSIALALSVAWNQLPYSGFAMMTRFCWTVTWSRLIRVGSFLVTVVPSPRPGCYEERFPPPPDTWWDWIMVGISEMRGFGGCNDLVFSGHAAFWVLCPLLFQEYYFNHFPRKTWFLKTCQKFMWILVFFTCLQDVNTQQHYSVDMFLGVVVTCLVWNNLEWIYPPSRKLNLENIRTGHRSPPMPILMFILGSILVGMIIVVFGRA